MDFLTERMSQNIFAHSFASEHSKHFFDVLPKQVWLTRLFNTPPVSGDFCTEIAASSPIPARRDPCRAQSLPGPARGP